MGHYDSDYADTEREITNERTGREMKAKRKLISDLDEFNKAIDRTQSHACDIPDRFKDNLEDLRNWLGVGLYEWEQEHLVKKLKGK